jgi:hypothetical protein
METPEGEIAGDVFYKIAFGKDRHYKHQGWLSGWVITDDNFTFYEKPVLNEHAPLVPEGDYVAKQSEMYDVSVDPSGKLGWKGSTLTYIDTTAHVIEVLTGRASNTYKDFLRRLGISYILAGEDKLDYNLAMRKLKELFGIETLMLGGGAALNWSFLQAGMCDEVSAVMAAARWFSLHPDTLSTVFPIGSTNDGFTQYFTGQSYLAPLSTNQVGILHVTFEPGCRNNWHIHHAKSGGGQILLCTAGRGCY